jgi:hypothetical protein
VENLVLFLQADCHASVVSLFEKHISNNKPLLSTAPRQDSDTTALLAPDYRGGKNVILQIEVSLIFKLILRMTQTTY